MPKSIVIKKSIQNFNGKVNVDGDKSLSIRFCLIASQGIGKSKAYNLLMSEDILSTINCLRRLGIQINYKITI